MAFRTADLIKETATSTGIGALTLLGARTPGRPFSATCSNGDTFEYCITHATLNEYEIGLGTYSTTGPTITRTTIYASSNSGSAVSFSAGVKNIDLVQPAYTVLSPAGNAVAATLSTANLVLGVGDMFNASSTGTITTISFDTVLMSDRLGRRAVIRFTAIRTITHNASTLILPTGANITTAAGDTCEVESLGGGTGVRMLWYTRANGRPLSLPTDGLTGILRADSGTLSVDTDVTDTVSTATTGAQGKVALATNADVLTGTNASLAVTPDALAAIWEAGVDNSDGATITLGDGASFNLITSTTTITAFAFTTNRVGRQATVRFSTVRTLTHNATSLILPTAADIITAVGDICVIESRGGSNFRVNHYTRASGAPLLSGLIRPPQIVTSTNASFAHPAGTRILVVEGVGGGGASGGASTTAGSLGSGGNSGTWGRRSFINPSLTSNITVGAGGTAGSAGAAGNTGGSSTLVNGATTVTLPGGTGGSVLAGNTTIAAASTNSATSAATNADISITGDIGGRAYRCSAANTSGISGDGGSNPLGQGGLGSMFVGGTSTVGAAGTGFGSGAAGRNNGTTVSNTAGTAGQPGVWIIYEYY